MYNALGKTFKGGNRGKFEPITLLAGGTPHSLHQPLHFTIARKEACHDRGAGAGTKNNLADGGSPQLPRSYRNSGFVGIYERRGIIHRAVLWIHLPKHSEVNIS